MRALIPQNIFVTVTLLICVLAWPSLSAAESLQDTAQGVEMAGTVQSNARVRAPVASRYVLEHEWQAQQAKAKEVKKESSQVPSGSLQTTVLPGVPDWFHFGAFVNARGNYIRNAEPTETDDDNFVDRVFFSSELKMAFDVHLPGNVYLHSLMTFRDNYGSENDGFELEEAFVAYDPQDWIATKIGRFRRWFGWERFDAPDLWRISNSYTHYNTGPMDGVGIYFSPETALTAGFFVVDEIITPDDAADTKEPGDMGYGVTFRASTSPKNLYKLDAFLDVNAAQSLTETDGASNVFGMSFNGSHDNIMDSPISAGFDLGTSFNADSVQIATMGTVRYDYLINDNLPAFTSIWLAGFWEDYSDESLAIAELSNITLTDNYRFEASLATFFFPTGSQRFRVGAEIAYVGSQIAEEDGFGAFIQMVYSLTEPHTNRIDPIRIGSLGAIDEPSIEIPQAGNPAADAEAGNNPEIKRQQPSTEP